MINPLQTAEAYEIFLYTLSDVFPSIRRSTLTFIRRGATLARVAGELHFDQGIRLVVRERLTFDRLPGTIESYGWDLVAGIERQAP